MELQWRRLILDDWGTCCCATLPLDVEPSRLLLLPNDVDPMGKCWTELVLLSRAKCCKVAVDYRLADYCPAYLGKLAADLETAQADGTSVFLWDVAGAVCLIGYAGLPGEAKPWCDLQQRHATAREALRQIDPTTME
jgi:hypothetical protein